MNNKNNKKVDSIMVNHSIANMLDVTPSYPVATQTSDTHVPKKSDKLFNTITVFSNIMFLLYIIHYNDLMIKNHKELFLILFNILTAFTIFINVFFLERLYKSYRILYENRRKVDLLSSLISLILISTCLFVNIMLK